jgi:CubicO group peptidase (beta-lactamase class C family)
MMDLHPLPSHVILAVLLLGVCRTAEGGSLQHDPADTTRDVPRLVLKDHTREVDAILTPLAHNGGPGACLLVMCHDSILCARGYGLADAEAREPITPRTNFRLASISKQFTAMAVVLLARDGKLALDDPARRYLPELPAFADHVTLRHILTHTSGLWAYEDLIPESQTVQVTDRDVLALLRNSDSTYFPSGSGYRYSNTGYALLALIVERVSGMTYSGFLKERIFVPLGMAGTVAHVAGSTSVGQRAFGYSERSFLRSHWFERTDQSLTSAVLGDGGIYSSAEDLRRWYRSLEMGGLAGDPWQKAIETPGLLTNGQSAGYGLGWEVKEYRGMPSLSHGGSSIGFSHAVRRIPANGFVAVLLTNQNDVPAFTFLDRIVDLWYPPITAGSPNPPPRE